MKGFFALAVKNLLRHKIRSCLSLVGITASTAVLFSVLSFNKGFQEGLTRELQRTGLHFMIVPSGCAHEVASLVLHGAVIPKFIETSVLEQIKDYKDLELITPILVSQLPNPTTQKIDLIYGLDMSVLRKIKPAWRIDGEIPVFANEVILGYEVAQHYKYKLLDRIKYPNSDTEFVVKGIVNKTNSQDDAFIYMPIASAQKLLKISQKATAIGVRVKDIERMGSVIDNLSSSIAGIQIVTMNQVNNTISNLAASAKVLSLSFAIIAFVISGVGVMNTLLTSVFERTAEIGMMRAIGATRHQIVLMIIIETLCLTSIGAVLGIVVSIIGKDFIELFLRKSIPYMPSGQLATFELNTSLLCILFSLLIGILSALAPAIRAGSIRPIEAIRS
ncbi:MAG: FtsX-like permease family protein [Thermodesulfovibrionales bacterium]|nr:FtsX-like permease family protein [Thermodesulfovibrionales bacterium]